jgi:acyl-CoA dehydrogenase
MDYPGSERLPQLMASLDRFIDEQLQPLEARDDNARFFDHRREYARTDWERDGQPHADWEALLAEARRLAREAGFLALALPGEYGGGDATNLEMAVLREHLAARGIGLHCDLQNEHCISSGTFPPRWRSGISAAPSSAQRSFPAASTAASPWPSASRSRMHGSDATWLETRAVSQARDGIDGWLLNGEKMWTTGAHAASHILIFARSSGADGSARGITCFVMPADSPGFRIEEWLWTFNMPTDHPRVSLRDVWLPETAILGEREGRGLAVAQHFVHENRIRQAASSLGTARYCIAESVVYARQRHTFGTRPRRATSRSSSASRSCTASTRS